MSSRPGLLPLLRCGARTSTAPSRGFHYLSRQPGSVGQRMVRPQQAKAIAIPRALPKPSAGTRVALALGLGLAGFSLVRPASLDAPTAAGVLGSNPNPNVIVVNSRATVEDPPESIVSVPQLTFGATCGICAGVFVKKGFKLVAFFLGGVFVLLQYLSSRRWVTVDWKAVSKSYDGAIATVDESGKLVYPTPTGVINGLIDFLTANFQQRATFVAGFILGLRLG